MERHYLFVHILLSCLVRGWCSPRAASFALSRNQINNIQPRLFLTNQTREDDVDVKVEVNVLGRNSTTVKAPKIRTDKEVLQKILHNPHSKEHVKAVKILKALVNHLKVQNNTNNTANEAPQTASTDLTPENTGLNIAETPHATPELTPSKSTESIAPNNSDNHIVNTFSPKNKKSKKKSKKKQKKKRPKKINKTVKTKTEANKNAFNKTETNNSTEATKLINKGLFTETLKQAIIESTVKALRKAYRNKTASAATSMKSSEDEKPVDKNTTEVSSNQVEKNALNVSETDKSNENSIAESFDSKASDLSSKTSDSSSKASDLSSKASDKGLPFYETTNVNIPTNNQTKIVTNIYKIIIHKNDSKDLQHQQPDYTITQQNKDANIKSFTRVSNDTESGSAGNPDDEGDEDEDDDQEEMNSYNANINRNKPSTMTGKTLTITFQENAASLGGSSTAEKVPVLPGSSHLNLKINQNDVSLESTKSATDRQTTPFIDETLKTDAVNNSEGLLHEAAAVRPQKLFNDSLFEEAGMKANDKKTNNNVDGILPERSNKKSFAQRPNMDKLSKITNGIGTGEEIDGVSLDMSGSGAGSGSIGEELFFAKNERLSDLAEMDTPIPTDNSKQMKEKRDIITASVKSFANNLLNHKLFIKKHPVNKVSVGDRDKPYKKHNILDKSNKRRFKTFTRLHPQKLVSARAEKRNELKLHRFDKKNVSLEDMSWNGEAMKYGSLVFKRNIVSEDDEPQMDTDQSSERFHKEMILGNHETPYVETSDKIFHKPSTEYNRRNEIPSREKIIAKRETSKKHKVPKKDRITHHSILSGRKKSKKGLPQVHQESGDKRINIPTEVIGNEGETVDDLYKFGTEADIHTRPIFSDSLDPFTQALAEKEKFAMSKSVRPNIQSPLSVLDTPIITGGPNIPQTQPGPSPITQEDEREAGQELMNFKNNLDLKSAGKAMVSGPEGLDAVDSNVSPLELQASEAESNNANLQPDMAQPHGEAQMNEETGVTEMENNADPTAISPEMNQLENNIEQPYPVKPVSALNNAPNAAASINAKEEAGKEVERAEAQETLMAEKKLKEMELARAQMEIKVRDRENAEAEKNHLFQRPALRSSPASSKNNATVKIKAQPNAANVKQPKPKVTVHLLPSQNKPKVTSQMVPSQHKKKVSALNQPITPVNKTKPVALTGKVEPNNEAVKTPAATNKTTEAIKVKTIFPPVWHLKVTKENAIGAPDADLVLSKRNKMRRKSAMHKRDEDSKENSVTETDNEAEKLVTSEADIPGVFAEKTDRKINRDFGSDNIDTETIVDDVRKRTPKLKNDVTIDEGLDTSKRHNVKKSAKISKKTNRRIGDASAEKRHKSFSPDSYIQDIRNAEVQASLRQDGRVRRIDKNGFISSVQILDSENPGEINNDGSNEFTSDASNKKLDAAEFDSEYQR